MLNYSTHALEDLSQLPLNHLTDDDSLALKEIRHHLHHGVKFELPENGCLFGDDYHKGYDVIEPSMLHLPFPSVVLEYPYSVFDGTPGNIAITKRIAVCIDYEAYKQSRVGEWAKTACPRIPETGGIIMMPIFWLKDRWTPYPFGVVIPRYEPDGTNLAVFMYNKNSESKVGFMPLPILITAARAMRQSLGDKAISNAINDCGEEISSLLGLLACLSCSNVKMHTNAAPDKLNVKRVKNGRLPFFEYKTIVVDVHRPAGSSGESHGGVSGRQSPREHLRRGHIRRLKDGRNIWVQAAVIGACYKGRIEKGYVVK